MLTKINGRLRFYSRIQEVRQLRRGHYVVVTTFGTFDVEGGKAAGGGKNEWFLEAADGSKVYGGKTLFVRSLVEALHTLDNT